MIPLQGFMRTYTAITSRDFGPFRLGLALASLTHLVRQAPRGRQAVLEAIHSAHVYHDALRRFDQPALRSVLLLPARGDAVDWLHERSLVDAHGVGVVTCSPDAEHRTDIVDELRRIFPVSVQSADGPH